MEFSRRQGRSHKRKLRYSQQYLGPSKDTLRTARWPVADRSFDCLLPPRSLAIDTPEQRYLERQWATNFIM